MVEMTLPRLESEEVALVLGLTEDISMSSSIRPSSSAPVTAI